jgi:hypothetical protein
LSGFDTMPASVLIHYNFKYKAAYFNFHHRKKDIIFAYKNDNSEWD